jgi:hypothetical protein
MSYNGDNLNMVANGIGGTGAQVWVYSSTDPSTDVDLTGYISDGGKRGMRQGDMVIVRDSDSTHQQTTSHIVKSVSTTYPGAVNLSDGVSIGGAADAD